jgi:hypothetical protein
VKTDVAVFQPDITGVRLSPIADFALLRDVSRSGGGGLSEVADRASR